jgi:hypothetical protein
LNFQLDSNTKEFISSTNRQEKVLIMLNNLRFLKEKLKERGELYCEYCNKGPLVIYDIAPSDINIESLSNTNILINKKFDQKDGATCDHKIPKSKGGDKFNFENLAVCCHRCNKRKGNMSWENWLRIIKR